MQCYHRAQGIQHMWRPQPEAEFGLPGSGARVESSERPSPQFLLPAGCGVSGGVWCEGSSAQRLRCGVPTSSGILPETWNAAAAKAGRASKAVCQSTSVNSVCRQPEAQGEVRPVGPENGTQLAMNAATITQMHGHAHSSLAFSHLDPQQLPYP